MSPIFIALSLIINSTSSLHVEVTEKCFCASFQLFVDWFCPTDFQLFFYSSQDCHGKNSNFEEILRDDTQNYIIENDGYQNLTHTIIVFKRSLETCDPRDVPITADTIKMFWGYGERDIVSTQLDKIKFKAKGIKSIHLLNPSFKKPVDSDVRHWDATVKNVS